MINFGSVTIFLLRLIKLNIISAIAFLLTKKKIDFNGNDLSVLWITLKLALIASGWLPN